MLSCAAALKALGTTVPADKLSVLIAPVVTPKHEEDAAEARSEPSKRPACGCPTATRVPGN